MKKNNNKKQTALTQHRSKNHQHHVLGWKDLCLGSIQDIKLHMNRRFLIQRMRKHQGFFMKCPFSISISPFDAEFHSPYRKNIKKIIALILEGFMKNLIFTFFCLFFHYKGPYQPIFSALSTPFGRGLLPLIHSTEMPRLSR